MKIQGKSVSLLETNSRDEFGTGLPKYLNEFLWSCHSSRSADVPDSISAKIADRSIRKHFDKSFFNVVTAFLKMKSTILFVTI